MNPGKIAALLGAVVGAAMAQAADAPPLESLAAPLLQAPTYCESGKFGFAVGANEPLPQHRYRVCADRDGRFKYVDSPGEKAQIVTWSDGRTLHRYVEYSRNYQQRDLAARGADNFYDNPQETTPALHSRIFRQATRGGAGLDLLGSLRSYRFNAELSDARQAVYEYRGGDDRRGVSRIRVANGAIVRYESVVDGSVRGYVEIASRQAGAPLAETDLAHPLPLLARFSPQNNAPVFLSGLFVVTALAGLAFWAWRFARAEHPYDIASGRGRLWRIFAWALGAVAAILDLLAVLTWGGSGHPPAIAYVMVLALLAGIGFGLVACFLLASYPAQALARARQQR